MTTDHLTEEELVLHYYGELQAAAATEAHLKECAECRQKLEELRSALGLAASVPVPERDAYYGSRVWHNIKGQLEPKHGFAWTWPRWAAAAAAMLVLVFLVGRWSVKPPERAAVLGEAGRERLLNAALVEHLDRSQRVLVLLANGEETPDPEWVSDVLSANRLYRQAALRVGDRRVAAVLEDVERLLVEAAHASPGEEPYLRQRVEDQQLVFKVRVARDRVRNDLPSGSF